MATHDVDIDQALETPQYYQPWIVLCFSVTAGVLEPLAITSRRQHSVGEAIRHFVCAIEAADFAAHFDEPVSKPEVLIEQNTVTIASLLAIAPPRAVDPTSAIYHSTMYMMAALPGIALLANAFMRSVDSRHPMQQAMPVAGPRLLDFAQVVLECGPVAAAIAVVHPYQQHALDMPGVA